MRRVLVTGASTPLGRAVSVRLRVRREVGEVVTVDVRGGVVDGVGGGSWQTRGTGHRSLREVIDDAAADTVVHVGMCPSRSGAASREVADVISTQQLTAAISGRASTVRVVVAVSSTEVYVPLSSAPLWRSEDEPLHPRPDSDAGLVLEAERYLRDLAESQPHISVAILRLSDLAGSAISGELVSLWRRPFVPYVIGYDPSIQVLHVDDAADAVVHAATRELAGTMNVAGAGAVTWRRTARLLGRPAVPAPIVPDSCAGMLTALGVPHVPGRLAAALRFGRCADTSALEASGFEPRFPTASCVTLVGERG